MPRRLLFPGFAAAALLTLTPQATLAADGDAGRGLEKSRQVCALCHVVEEGGSGNASLPTFEGIAKDPATDAARLRAWQAAPHPQMPQFGSLSDQDVADIIVYIESLK